MGLCAHGQEVAPRGRDLYRIAGGYAVPYTPSLTYINGALRIDSFPRRHDLADMVQLRRLVWLSQLFRMSGDTIRVFVRAGNLEAGRLNEHDAKHNYYLTGDYSTVPPQVILTKTPEKCSHWEKVPVDPSKGTVADIFFLRNKNDLGKDAWLWYGNEGEDLITSPPGAKQPSIGWYAKPILSFDQKLAFQIIRYDGPDGK